MRPREASLPLVDELTACINTHTKVFNKLRRDAHTHRDTKYDTHKSISKRFPTERYKEGREERSSDYVVSVTALGGNCSGTRGDTETASSGPDRDITKGAQRDKTGGDITIVRNRPGAAACVRGRLLGDALGSCS